MRLAFIHAEKAFFPVAALCRVLGVSRQGYYAFANRPLSARVAEVLMIVGTRGRMVKFTGEEWAVGGEVHR